MARPLDAIERDVAAAEQARDDLLLSDDLAMVTGAWGRANGLVLRLRAELREARA